MGKDNWKLEQFLELLQFLEPLTLQTLMSALEEKFEQKNKNRFSKQKEKIYLFCKEEHYSDKCSKVNADDRREILKRNRYCLKCMKLGHSKAKCKSREKYFKCLSFGHHTALYRNIDEATGEDKNNPANTDEEQKDLHKYLICHDKSVLLQTAKGVITNIDESKTKSVRILFDFCSQSSYVTERQ